MCCGGAALSDRVDSFCPVLGRCPKTQQATPSGNITHGDARRSVLEVFSDIARQCVAAGYEIKAEATRIACSADICVAECGDRIAHQNRPHGRGFTVNDRQCQAIAGPADGAPTSTQKRRHESLLRHQWLGFLNHADADAEGGDRTLAAGSGASAKSP